MAQGTRKVTVSGRDVSETPSWCGAGVVILQDLFDRGMLAELGERLQIRREGGYAGLDVFVFLVYFFCSQVSGGLRPFREKVGTHGRLLSAVAGRKALASSAAMSRALASVESWRTNEVVSWLLTEVPKVDAVLKHPGVLAHDGHGAGWHVFDYDPTVTVLRQRALPSRPGLPPAIRRAKGLAKPGHSGRKRGEVQFRRSILQHAGAGLWVDSRVSPGNGDRRSELPLALDAVVSLAARLGHPLERCLIRMDGEYGWVPDFTACREAGVPFLTRINRPKLLDDPDVRRKLSDAIWSEVPDSGSGPRRSAAELDLITVAAGKGTYRSGGGRYEPIEVRVVVSRYWEVSGAGRGRVIAGWRYELFAADIPASSWPPADVVAFYYGRTGEENRFAQEDRELHLDRIFSYHPDGQEFATLIGLMVWNIQICMGFSMAPPPKTLPPQLRQVPVVDLRPVPAWPPLEKPIAPPIPQTLIDIHAKHLEVAEQALVEALDALDWSSLISRRPGWRWAPSEGGLICPNGRTASLTSLSGPTGKGKGRLGLCFRVTASECGACAVRSECIHSASSTTAKMVRFTIDHDRSKSISKLLPIAQERRTILRFAQLEKKARPPRKSPFASSPTPGRPGPADEDIGVGGHEPRPPLLLPAVARARVRNTLRDVRATIHVRGAETRNRRDAMLARSPAERQHRRLTWQQHLKRNALAEAAVLTISISVAKGRVRTLAAAGIRCFNGPI